jgi:2-succinyl-6-hydroxy-2,4-cyclohexadiene-1-carboxylate synthase
MSRRHVTPWAWQHWGSPEAPPLLLLHGFTGCKAFWAPLAEAWAERWYVLAPDLPGHGDSPPPGPDEGLEVAAEQLASAMPAAATVVGYSLGGRLALHLAIAHPERVERLVLVGASAGLPEEVDRAARRLEDARWVSMLRHQGLEAFLDAWEALPLFAGHRAATPERQAWLRGLRAGQSAEGLAASLEAHGLGRQAALHELLRGLPVPTWWVAGERDAKFAAIAQAMARSMPRGQMVLVPECGHNVPFERPAALLALVDDIGRHVALPTDDSVNSR